MHAVVSIHADASKDTSFSSSRETKSRRGGGGGHRKKKTTTTGNDDKDYYAIMPSFPTRREYFQKREWEKE